MPGRFLCLHLADLPLEAHLAAATELRRHAVAVVDGDGPAARVLAVSPRAAAARVRVGMGAAAARRQLPGIELRVRDRELERHALEEFEAVAAGFSPTLELAGEGTLFLDADGVSGLFGGELEFGEALRDALAGKHLQGLIGVAASRAGAVGAARWRGFLAADAEPAPTSYQARGPVTVLSPGADAAFLAPLLLGVLDPTPMQTALLNDLGVRTLGALRRMRGASVVERLGPEGLELRARAGGEDPRLCFPAPRPEAYRQRLELDEAQDTLPALLGIAEHLLARLLPPLVDEGLAVGGLRLGFGLESGGVDLLVLNPASPAREVGPLLRLLEARLAREPPRGPVLSAELELRATRIRPVQLSLFLPAGPSPRQLHGLVSRVEGLVGTTRLGAPVVADDHRPAAFADRAFGPRPARHGAGDPPALGSLLRAFRPPLQVRVRTRSERPVGLAELPASCRLPPRLAVRRAAGPWVLSGGWWSPRPFRRAYWDLEVEGGRLVRVFQDLQGDRWWLDGVHD